MSADNIVRCPNCGHDRLREWTTCGIDKDDDGYFYFKSGYTAVCFDCDWDYQVPLTRRRIVT